MATPYVSMAMPPARISCHVDVEAEPAADRVDHPPGGIHDLRPDPVAGDRGDPVGGLRKAVLGHGSPSSERGETNATETPLISAPWSLLVATR